MADYSYFSKIFIGEFNGFMDMACEGLSKPDSKLLRSLTFGILKKGKCILSSIARALSEDVTLDATEHRLQRRLATCGFSRTQSNIVGYVSAFLVGKEGDVALDESDIQKPYGKAFESLDTVQDGSEDGRPKGKGYHVIGVAAIGWRRTPIPLAMRIYSSKSDGYESQLRETEKAIPEKGWGCLTADRGYDGSLWAALASSRGMAFCFRGTSQRKYLSPLSEKPLTGDEMCSRVKGRYAFTFKDPDKKEDIYVKASGIRVTHKDFQNPFWIAIEFFQGGKDARFYLTSIDCSSRRGIESSLKLYRLRWRIEEFFRFVKGHLGLERMMVRGIAATNNLLIAAECAVLFLSEAIEWKTAFYKAAKAACKSFRPELSDEEMKERYGHYPIELYRIMGGAQEILGHIRSVGRAVKAKAKTEVDNEQLKLF